MKNCTYKDTGVNIKLGDEASKILYNAAKCTWKNRKGKLGEVIVPFDDYSGIRLIDVSNLPSNTMMNIGFDGVGTKIEVAERMSNYSTIAYDLFAMVCDDAVVRGGEPVLVGSILDVRALSDKKNTFIKEIKQLAQGYTNAANEANVVIVNGEIAELGNRVGGFGKFNCNWGASVVWFAKKDRMFTGYEIEEGDYLIALKEDGFRSNGLSIVRKILHDTYGDSWIGAWHDQWVGEAVLLPSKIYCKSIIEMIGTIYQEPKAEVHGIVHITGGGMPGKLRRTLKVSKLGASINDPFDPTTLMLYCQEKGNVEDREAYSTWNMGQGMIVISPQPDKVMNIAYNHSINSKVVGIITSNQSIKIKNRGYFNKDKFLTWEK